MKMPNDASKIIECRDCKHRRQVENIVPFCNLTKNDKGQYRYCSVERTKKDGCGPDGVNFSPLEVENE